MFEKEAEELIEESKRLNTTPRETVCKAIEFGFQKGIKAKINTTTISDCPIKDEWHYVKDGDLPSTDGVYVVCLKDYTQIGFAPFILGWHEGKWYDKNGTDFTKDVICWQNLPRVIELI